MDDADDDNGVDLEDGEAVDVTPEYSIGGVNVNFKVACRNLYNVKVCNQIGGNVYDILKHEKLVMTLSAMKSLEERLSP
jgi:ribosomal protein L4